MAPHGLEAEGDRHNDLGRFARSMQDAATFESLNETEQRVQWQVHDRSGQTQTMALRSGLSLMTAQVQWDSAWALAIKQPRSALKFMLLRGEGPRLSTSDGQEHKLSGATFHVSQIHQPTELRFDFDATSRTNHHEELGLEIEPARLCELLGSTQLPPAVTRVAASTEVYPTEEFLMTPALSRLFDEITHCNARGRSRHLHLDAKGLELLATLVDTLDEVARAPRLSPHDVERLELARQLLLTNLCDPPTILALAKCAGLNQTKLKAGFHVLYGSSIYAYLRSRRMEAAQRLLLEQRYSVTEVALRVGYSNPSKFAAAFRRHFGVPPGRN